MFEWHFYPVIDDGFVAVAAAGLVLVLLLFLGPGRNRIGPRQRGVLLGLRLAVVALVIAAMLRPTLVYTTSRKQPATLVILADKSRSMSVCDEINGKSRYEVLVTALAAAHGPLRKMASEFEVKPYAFDSISYPAGFDSGTIALPEQPDGRQTAIGSVLEDVLAQEAGKRLLGVILLSDGAQRAYPPRDALPQGAAARMKHLGYPLYTIRFGQPQGLGRAQDVAVTDLLADPYVSVKTELSINAQVRVDGFANRELPVKLLFENAEGKMDVVDQTTIKAGSGGETCPVTFNYTPQKPGEYKLSVEVDSQGGELITTNNHLSTFVNVLKGGLRVLYVEGALRMEQRFLRNSLDASKDIHVDYVRLDPRRPEVRPSDLADRFKPGKYDAYLLGDVPAAAFQERELADLAAAVSKGAGLIMLGGLHSFGPGGYAESPLADVLPIVMNRLEKVEKLDAPPPEDLHLSRPFKMSPTSIGLSQTNLLIAPTRDQSKILWERLPALDGANKFQEVKPGALVLAVADHDDSQPILVSQAYGNGRVMALAADSTWRWWMHGYQTAHRLFWRQTILWLSHKDQMGEGRVRISLAQRRFSPGQRVDFTLQAQVPSGEMVPEATFQVEVETPGGTKQTVAPLKTEQDTVASFRETQPPGDYTIRVTATHQGQTLGTARARFQIFEQDLELDNAVADANGLESLAAMTGGRSQAPEQLSDLVTRLAQDTSQLDVQTEEKQSLWDNWTFFLLFVGLLGIEWFLRKRWGLV